jgi:putative restriction endonuclease
MAIGEIQGIPLGSPFATRRKLYESGVHRALQAGIVGGASTGAESIVLSGGYVDDEDLGSEIIYTGRGGRDPSSGRQIADQQFTGQNQALVTSCLQGLPVRVVRGSQNDSPNSPTSGYRYDGLYRVDGYWHAPGNDGFLVCQYRLLTLNPNEIVPIVPHGASGVAPRVSSTVLRIVRDTAVSRSVKQLYDFRCQICGTRLECEGGPYAEAAHIRPLGSPHHGPDVIGNILCLCPNHHVLFDNGAISVADDFSLIGLDGRLDVSGGHAVDVAQLAHQRRMWGR